MSFIGNARAGQAGRLVLDHSADLRRRLLALALDLDFLSAVVTHRTHRFLVGNSPANECSSMNHGFELRRPVGLGSESQPLNEYYPIHRKGLNDDQPIRIDKTGATE